MKISDRRTGLLSKKRNVHMTGLHGRVVIRPTEDDCYDNQRGEVIGILSQTLLPCPPDEADSLPAALRDLHEDHATSEDYWSVVN